MVMNRRHLEDTLLAQFVGCDLQDHGNGLDDEHAAYKRQQQFLLNHDCHCTDCASKSQRAYVSHKNFGWMCVIPKKADGRPHHGPAENGQFSYLWHTLQFEV